MLPVHPARFPSLLLGLLCLGVPVLGADGDLAVWASGLGQVAGAEATAGTGVAPGAEVVSGETPVRLTLAKAPKSSLILAPLSSLSIIEKDGGCFVLLKTGIVQANIEDKGAYTDLHVLGAALDVRVTGTLFLVQRVKADTDYVSLIEGRVKVSLRDEVALALGRAAQVVELNSRQGLGAGVGGFGGIDALAARPQLPTTSVAMRSASIKVTEPAAGGTWTKDEGLSATTPAGDTTPPPSAPPSAPPPAVPVEVAPPPVSVPTTEIQAGVSEQVRSSVSNAVSKEVVQAVKTSIQAEVVNQVVSTAVPLGRPPGPPAK